MCIYIYCVLDAKADMLTREIIERANRHPLVSGFYKLLSIAMKVREFCTSISNIF